MAAPPRLRNERLWLRLPHASSAVDALSRTTIMRVFRLLPLLSIPLVWSLPSNELQDVLNELGSLQFDLLGDIAKEVVQATEAIAQKLDHAQDTIRKGQEKVEQWAEDGKQFVKQDGLVCEWSEANHELLNKAHDANDVRRACDSPLVQGLPASFDGP